MTTADTAYVWQPPQQIKFKVMGVSLRGEDTAQPEMFLQEVFSSCQEIKGYRPPGGSVEFGELSGDALLREFYEELDVKVEIQRFMGTVENIYTHDGLQGHEIISFSQVKLPPHLMEGKRHEYTEDRGNDRSGFVWLPYRLLIEQGKLFPLQLAELI